MQKEVSRLSLICAHDVVKHFIAERPDVALRVLGEKIRWLAQYKVILSKREPRVRHEQRNLICHVDKMTPEWSQMDVLYVMGRIARETLVLVPRGLALRPKPARCYDVELLMLVHEVKCGAYREEHRGQILRYLCDLRDELIGWRSVGLALLRMSGIPAPETVRRKIQPRQDMVFWRAGNDWYAMRVLRKMRVAVLWHMPWYDTSWVRELRERGLRVYTVDLRSLLRTEEFKRYLDAVVRILSW